jgi:hypothetical protein
MCGNYASELRVLIITITIISFIIIINVVSYFMNNTSRPYILLRKTLMSSDKSFGCKTCCLVVKQDQRVMFTTMPRRIREFRQGGNEQNDKQDRQCTYNVTLRRVRESPLPWKSSIMYFCVCVCVCVGG